MAAKPITEEQEQAAREAERKRVRESIEQDILAVVHRAIDRVGRVLMMEAAALAAPGPPRLVPTWIAAPDGRSFYLHYDGAPPQTCVAAWVQACTVLSVDEPQRWGWRIYLPGEHPRAAAQGDDLPSHADAKNAAVLSLKARGFAAPERFGGPAEVPEANKEGPGEVRVPRPDWIDLHFTGGPLAATIAADEDDWCWYAYDRTGQLILSGDGSASAHAARAHCLDVLRSKRVRVVLEPAAPATEPALLWWSEVIEGVFLGRPTGVYDGNCETARIDRSGIVSPDGTPRWLVEIKLGVRQNGRMIALAPSVDAAKQAAEELLLEYFGQQRGAVWGLIRTDGTGVVERLDLDGKPIRYASPREAVAAKPKHVPAGTRYEAVLLGPLPAGSAGAG